LCHTLCVCPDPWFPAVKSFVLSPKGALFGTSTELFPEGWQFEAAASEILGLTDY